MMDDYNDVSFVMSDGSFDLTPCPERNTEVLKKFGLNCNGGEQLLDGARIYPCDYFCPMDFLTGKIRKTKNTHTVHLFSASWQSEAERKHHEERRKYLRREKYLRFPKRVLIKALGRERFEKIKNKFKRG